MRDLDIALALCGWTPSTVLCGLARGADAIGDQWAKLNGVPVEYFPADWSTGKGAGYFRNERMAVRGDALIALWDGQSRGTARMIRTARDYGLRVWVQHARPLWARHHADGYEVSTKGDKRFSALNARLPDGRTIEEAYQLDVKGYRDVSNDWRSGKGRPPLRIPVDLWGGYLGLWGVWARRNPKLIEELACLASGKVLTDCFATTEINQAHALAILVHEANRKLG